jgi:hypothetical protein
MERMARFIGIKTPGGKNASNYLRSGFRSLTISADSNGALLFALYSLITTRTARLRGDTIDSS